LALRNETWSAARRAFEEAESGGQESPTTNVGLGFLALREGRGDEAHTRFRRALEIATDRLNTVYDIVDLCDAHGFGGDARAYASELVALASGAIAADPGQPSLYATRAVAYSALGEERLAERDRTTRRSLLGWWSEPADRGTPEVLPPVQ
jgi:Tfp pilus assembly protein PilF